MHLRSYWEINTDEQEIVKELRKVTSTLFVKMNSKKYIIRKALHEESKEGWVWLSERIKNSKFNLVKIKCVASNKTIIVSQRQIDSLFMDKYNVESEYYQLESGKDYIVISEHYRNILETDEVGIEDLLIKPAKLIDRLKYLNQHPNESVIISYQLAMFAIILSIFPVQTFIEKIVEFIVSIFMLICSC